MDRYRMYRQSGVAWKLTNTVTATGPGLGNDTILPPPDHAAGGVGIPFTGVAAAEAALHAISSAPPFPGLDTGRELGRLARRAADLRE